MSQTLKPLGAAGRWAVIGASEIGLRPILGRSEGHAFVPALKYAGAFPSDNVNFAQRMLENHPRFDRVGLVMGQCRLGNVFAFDLDRNHNGDDGIASMRALLNKLGIKELPRGPRVLTPRLGLQMLFRAPLDVEIRRMTGAHAIAPGVDCLGGSSLMTIPPTVRFDGEYRWCGDLSLFSPRTLAQRRAFIPYAPAELVALVTKRAGADAPAIPAAPITPLSSEAEEARRCAYVEASLEGILRDAATAAIGSRNGIVNWCAAKLAMLLKGDGRGRINPDVAYQRLEAAALASGLDRREARSAIRSGLCYGRSASAPATFTPAPKHSTQRGHEPREASKPRAAHVDAQRNAAHGAEQV